jgi:hypothetical protein
VAAQTATIRNTAGFNATPVDESSVLSAGSQRISDDPSALHHRGTTGQQKDLACALQPR